MKNLRDILNESCGLAGAVNIPIASEVVRQMILVQQHRGEAGAGIASSNNNNLQIRKDKGRVDVVFPDNFDYQQILPGDMAIGHNRYATKGSVEERCNVQPLLFKETNHGQIAIGHNGQLIDIYNERERMVKNGAIFQSTTDSETIMHLISQSDESDIEQAIASEIKKIPAAYSILIMTPSKLIALRDRYGIRPLAIAQIGEGYLVASETTAFRIFDNAQFVRHVNPGEMVIFDKNKIKSGKGFQSVQFAEPDENWCIFEGIYFSDPRSEYNGFMHEDFRQECGIELYRQNKEFFDSLKEKYSGRIAVIPLLDSGKQGAIGFSKGSGIPYKEYFMRRHNAPKAKGRSYTAAYQDERTNIANMKLDLRSEKVDGICAITIDDSEVRGTTITSTNQRLRKAGAALIVNGVLSPMLKGTCVKGMDHQTLNELIAYQCGFDVEKIAEITGSNRTIYLSLDGLNGVVDITYRCGICSGCFGGKYPINLNESK